MIRWRRGCGRRKGERWGRKSSRRDVGGFWERDWRKRAARRDEGAMVAGWDWGFAVWSLVLVLAEQRGRRRRGERGKQPSQRPRWTKPADGHHGAADRCAAPTTTVLSLAIGTLFHGGRGRARCNGSMWIAQCGVADRRAACSSDAGRPNDARCSRCRAYTWHDGHSTVQLHAI
jgi:hypothetical protein